MGYTYRSHFKGGKMKKAVRGRYKASVVNWCCLAQVFESASAAVVLAVDKVGRDWRAGCP